MQYVIRTSHTNPIKANYLRDPIGVRHPALNGVEVLENREYMTVSIETTFANDEDLAIAEEIVATGLADHMLPLNVKRKTNGDSLEVSFSMPKNAQRCILSIVFRRELMLGASQDTISAIAGARM